MSEVDVFRCQYLRSVADLEARTLPWDAYRSEIRKLIGDSPSANDVYSLGSKLKQVFKADPRTRSQGDLSRGGASWEILVSWYLNLVFWNTNVVAMRPSKKLTPSVVSEALAVKVKGFATNKETDLLVIEVPSVKIGLDHTRESIDLAIRKDPKKSSIGVIQCKTNWNDNAQIPMLWNIIYAAQNLQVQNVAVGSNGFGPASFGRFTYSFVTVPTNTEKNGKDNFKPGTTAVVRVQGMTGGNFWGNQSVNGVADSISEYFGRNFGHVFEGGVQNHISRHVVSQPDVLQMFIDYSFG